MYKQNLIDIEKEFMRIMEQVYLLKLEARRAAECGEIPADASMYIDLLNNDVNAGWYNLQEAIGELNENSINK